MSGAIDERNQQIEGARAQGNGFAVLQQPSLVRLQLEGAEAAAFDRKDFTHFSYRVRPALPARSARHRWKLARRGGSVQLIVPIGAIGGAYGGCVEPCPACSSNAQRTASSRDISRPSRHASLNSSSPHAARADDTERLCSAWSWSRIGAPTSSPSRSAAPHIRAACRDAPFAEPRRAKPSSAFATPPRSPSPPKIVIVSLRCASAAPRLPCNRS